jgi:hypothetical protein
MPKVITIENGLTVAKDGSGQFKTIGEALGEVTRPGMTIRVLDKARYTEPVHIDKRGRMDGLTLESPQGATLLMPPGETIGLLVFNVPRVTVRGFHLRSDKARSFLCIVGGKSPSTTLEALDFEGSSGSVGLSIEQANLSQEDAPITVRKCVLAGLYRGLRVSGASDTGAAAPSRRIVLRDNNVSDCLVGIWVGGLVSDVHIVGNRVWNCTAAALQVEELLQGSSNLLIANNSLKNERSCLQIQQMSQVDEGIAIRNNLLLAGRGPDLEFLGKNPPFLAACRLDHNWREVPPPGEKTPDEETWVPFNSQDVHQEEQMAGLARDPKDATNFLRPAKDSPLAAGGAGGELPTYVGAVPPEGVEPWDWDKTWNARTSKFGKESHTGKD